MRDMGVPIVLVLANAIFFSLMATICVIVAISTTSWETLNWDIQKLKLIYQNTSTMTCYTNYYPEFQVFTVTNVTVYRIGNMSHKVSNAYTMFPISGGIWKICDTLPAELRDGIRNNSWNKMNQCFTYIHDYLGQIDLRFNDKGRWLIRMQNSAASCVIVCIISVITAKMTGILSIVCKQVAVCTVTAVMYMLAACFMIFGLTITHAKIADYITKRCYNLNDDPPAACSARIAEVGWSVAMGWVGAAFLIISFMSWAGLARTMRIEKSKIIL